MIDESVLLNSISLNFINIEFLDAVAVGDKRGKKTEHNITNYKNKNNLKMYALFFCDPFVQKVLGCPRLYIYLIFFFYYCEKSQYFTR